MNKTVFKTFLTQMASPQLSHRIEHKAGLPCAPFCNLIVAQPFEIWKFWNQHLFCLMGTFWYLQSISEKKIFYNFFHFHFIFIGGTKGKIFEFFQKFFFFSEIPLQNKMYPKTINKNHFQTSLIPRVGPQFSWRMEHMLYFTAELWASPWD